MISSASTLGLLGHELRLTWRGWFGRRADGKLRGLPQLIITAIFLMFMLMVAGVPLGLHLRGESVDVTPLAAAIGLAATAALFTLMLSQTLVSSVNAFYDRGDLDLLLSSPVSPVKVLAVRAVSMSLSAVMIFVALVSPVLLPIAVLGHPAWLAGYLVLAAVSWCATGVGLVLAIALMRTIGPRRTKTAAQLLAAVIGAAFFIASQIQNILGGQQAGGFWSRLIESVRIGRRELPEVASWPVRAALGQPGPLIAVVGVGLAVLALSVTLVGRRFAQDAAAAKGADATARQRGPVREANFRGGASSSLLSKEARLMWRDPAMMSQVLLRVLYIPPLVFLLIRNAADGVASAALGAAAAGVVFMAGQVSASLSWITISAEEAPELLVMSPAPIGAIWRAKLTAALIPLAVVMAIPLGVLAWFTPKAAAISFVGAAAAAISAGLINIWLQKPGSRRDFRRRKSASLAATVAELLVAGLWAGAVFMAINAMWVVAVVPAALAVILLIVCRRSEEAILRRLSEKAP